MPTNLSLSHTATEKEVRVVWLVRAEHKPQRPHLIQRTPPLPVAGQYQQNCLHPTPRKAKNPVSPERVSHCMHHLSKSDRNPGSWISTATTSHSDFVKHDMTEGPSRAKI